MYEAKNEGRDVIVLTVVLKVRVSVSIWTTTLLRSTAAIGETRMGENFG